MPLQIDCWLKDIEVMPTQQLWNVGDLEQFINKPHGDNYYDNTMCFPVSLCKENVGACEQTNIMHKNAPGKIIITNIDDGEIVHHSFLLVKATVHHNDCIERNVKVCLKASGAPTCFEPTTQDYTHYTCLVELMIGKNHVLVSCSCHLRADFHIHYLRRETNLEVVPLYVVNEGHDGKFQAPVTETNTVKSACERILTGCKLLQCFISEKLAEGTKRKTFQIKSGDCIVFNSKLRSDVALRMTQSEHWAHLGREIMQSEIGSENCKYFAFLACTKYNGNMYDSRLETHDEIVALTDGYVALGGGGLALFGTACLYTWPENVHEVTRRFNNFALVDKTRFMDDSCYRGTLGACFSTTLGSALHELCHTFDLGHTTEGIMGRGFDKIGEFFTAPSKPTQLIKRKETIHFTQSTAALLYYHKFFNDFPRISKQGFTLTFDHKSNLLKSTAGIRVVEIRDDVDENVLDCWVFPGRVLRFSFQVARRFSERSIVVVEDNAGNILKCNLCV